MSRPKPAQVRTEPPAAPKAEPGPVSICYGCRHWRDRGDLPGTETKRVGVCTLNPPSVVKQATGFGPLCAYPVTAATELACSRAAPK